MACEYCRADKRLIDTALNLSKKGDFYPGITIGLCNGDLWITAVSDTHEPNYQDANVEINFCPMCGERLIEEEDE